MNFSLLFYARKSNSANLRRLLFKNFPGEHAPDPLEDLRPKIELQNTELLHLKVKPPNPLPPAKTYSCVPAIVYRPTSYYSSWYC